MNPDEQVQLVAIARKWWPTREICWEHCNWGWPADVPHWHSNRGSPTRDGAVFPGFAPDVLTAIPDFLHDWAAMGLLLERVKEKGWCVNFYIPVAPGELTDCDLMKGSQMFQGRALTLPAAVAAAAEAVPDGEIEERAK